MIRANLIGNEWDEILGGIFKSAEYAALREFLISEYNSRVIYPHMDNIYNALRLASPQDVKVVILGQDPYIKPNQAHGLAFSVKSPEPPPPSLQNIFKEIGTDLGIEYKAKDGDLTRWAEQGVLLLNSVLTVRAGASNSHQGKGWEMVTSAVIRHLVENSQPIVFMLWGRNAQNVFESAASGIDIDAGRKLVLKAAHPSPLSAYNGFFGCKHFSAANGFLEKVGLKGVDW